MLGAGEHVSYMLRNVRRCTAPAPMHGMTRRGKSTTISAVHRSLESELRACLVAMTVQGYRGRHGHTFLSRKIDMDEFGLHRDRALSRDTEEC